MADLDLAHSSDPVLAIGIGRHRPEALAELFRRHGATALCLAGWLLHDRKLAEDVVHEIFCELWRGPRVFDPDQGSLRSHLLAETRRHITDAAASGGVHRSADEMTAGAYDLNDEAFGFAVDALAGTAVARLPDDERRAIILAFFCGQTYREVATTLGESDSVVMGLITSGLRLLRDDLLGPEILAS